MPEEKSITSADLSSNKPVAQIGTAENKRDTSGDQTVRVRALKHFHKNGDMTGELTQLDEEFEVSRHRASQLRANGLIEYANDSDDKAIHGDVESKRIAEKVKLQGEQSRIPENSRGTPLVNPEVKMAERPAEPAGKRR